MKKHFYSHIVEIDSIYIELDLLDMTPQEREHLSAILESTIQHAVLNALLLELSDENKKTFLSHLVENDHEKIWNLLNTHVPRAEKKIAQSVDKLKLQLKKDIQKTKKRKS